MDVRLEENTSGYRTWTCFTCGSAFELEAVVAVATWPISVDGRAAHVYLCRACIAAGVDHIRDRMRGHAERLRNSADEILSLSDGPISLPSTHDWDTHLTTFNAQLETEVEETSDRAAMDVGSKELFIGPSTVEGQPLETLRQERKEYAVRLAVIDAKIAQRERQ